MSTLPSDTPGSPCYRIAVAASICHEASRELLAQFGDTSLKAWGDAEAWQRESAITGVKFLLANPSAGPGASHEAWACQKIADGWKYGPAKDAEKKEHPCLVAFDKLPVRQQLNDQLFVGIVRALFVDDVPAPANESPSTKNQERPAPPVRVLMLNRRWGHGAPEGGLQGYSGKRWTQSTSRYLPQYACHGIEITLEEYEACREDIFKAAQLSGRTWEPVVLLEVISHQSGGSNQSEPATGAPLAPHHPLVPPHIAALAEFRAGYDFGVAGDPVPKDASPSAAEGYFAGRLVRYEVARSDAKGAGTTINIALPDIETAKLSALRDIAKEEGIDLTGVKNDRSARKRIREARSAMAVAA